MTAAPDPGRPQPWPSDVYAALLRRRIVVVSGPLTDEVATRAAAELMLLDADAVDPVQLLLSSAGGDLDAALMLAGTVDLVRGPVTAVAQGRLAGAALAPFAAAARRLAGRHSVLELTEPRSELAGRATEIATGAARQLAQLGHLHERVAAASGRPVDLVAADFSTGTLLTADGAVAYGLVDALVPGGPLPGVG